MSDASEENEMTTETTERKQAHASCYDWIDTKTGEAVIMETIAHSGLDLWSGTAMIYTEKRGWHWRCSTFKPAKTTNTARPTNYCNCPNCQTKDCPNALAVEREIEQLRELATELAHDLRWLLVGYYDRSRITSLDAYEEWLEERETTTVEVRRTK